MRRRSLSSFLAAAPLALFALLVPTGADAHERQWHVGGTFGFSALLGETADFLGTGGGIHAEYGVNDAINLAIRADVFSFPDLHLMVPTAGVGVVYIIDVLRWVPYFGGLAGATDFISSNPSCGTEALPCHDMKLALQIPFGLDYLVTRNFAVGAAGKYQLMLGASGFEQSIGGFVRAEFIWGF